MYMIFSKDFYYHKSYLMEAAMILNRGIVRIFM